MAMVVKNNIAAQNALGELNKNISKLGEALAKVSSGMKINSAKDDSAQFAISEVMRVRIRALSQAMQNVQNGNSLLKVAEEGIQQQIDIMRTIKEKVINAANDHNTDVDRKIIQKEVNQFYDQIEQTAVYTDYNTHKPLLGNTVKESVIKKIPYLEKVQRHLSAGDPGISGEMNIIENKYMTLDGLTGPFDTFEDYVIAETSISSLGFNPSMTISSSDYNATPYESANTNSTSTTKISNWDKAADTFMNNRGFRVTYSGSETGITETGYYVLTKTPGANTYQNSGVKEINISGCSSVSEVMAEIDNTLNCVKAHSGGQITVDKDYTLTGFTEFIPRQATTSDSGPFTTRGNFSGAVYAQKWVEETEDRWEGDRFFPGRPGYYTTDYANTKSGSVSKTLDLSAIENDSGFTIYNQNNSAIGYVRFVDGPLYSDANTTTETGHQRGDDGVALVSKSWLLQGKSVSFSAGVSVSITSSIITLSASPSSENSATNINQYYATNGISAASGSNNVRIRALGFDKQSSDATIDLSAYQTTDKNVLENFIQEVAGKALMDNSGYNTPYYANRKNSYTNSSYGYYYEFIDSQSQDPSKNKSKIVQYESNYNVGSLQINLNTLRNTVGTTDSNGRVMTIADAFAKLFDDQTAYSEYVDGNYVTRHRVVKNYNSDGVEESGVKSIQLSARNVTAYDSTITATEGVLRHYDLDFNQWFEDHADLVYYEGVSDEVSIAEYIDGKGFRAFCATDATEWFNFIYRNGKENFKDESFDTGSANIHTIQIDVSAVHSAEDLANAIFEQAEPELQTINHHLHLKKTDSGVVTIYDQRPLANQYYRSETTYVNFQTGSGTDMNGNAVNSGGGAKIADGIIESDEERDVWESVLNYREESVGKLFVKKLIIQDTDHADMNLQLQIPQTTLNNIFYPLPNDTPPEYKDSIYDYDVTTKENRDILLSNDEVYPPYKGLIDRGIDYLLDAAVLVGAQRARLEFAGTNLVTQVENEISSESTIRDADMAKEMAEYTKANVLSQSAQAMLAQANQNSSGVLSLLQ